jgi:hypothetical protein
MVKTAFAIAILATVLLFSCREEKQQIIPGVTVLDRRDSFVGTYTITDTNHAVGTYTLTVTRDSSIRDTVYLANLFNSKKKCYAVLSTKGARHVFTIPQQQYFSPFFVKGNGSFGFDGTLEYTAATTTAYGSWKGNGKKNE